ncbi:N-acetylglucosamine 6-phosphate deacetylase [Cribrihabitans marinus]|uniref:N-acetylglucosamine 6-phosphate deacetylase n=1 Tax=Cribrihabitans marinus TaxID=1227549 RepID=A0A1H7D707_9RHOB|nr:N-acetylglucosamine-6-phosphate deacetylase [Cribrihabitans marinus]GGH37310.1 N-acetylglucosamine-6-phosphate deacetylase [Cribrihabitans marinus]SEJ95352.1 N-acetylglucosamine 6-phosphate deacetylase [Cribrihabitans marinus]
MSGRSCTYRGGAIFDGARLLAGHVVRVVDGSVAEILPEAEAGDRGDIVDLEGDILSPGYVDLQVNGGDGIMFNDAPEVETLARMAAAHRRLGATSILPTLITDTPERTRAAIAAAVEAVRQGVPGIAGLHLEGPHLSVARKGAHDPTLIRPMGQADLDRIFAAAADLPALMVTLAPENVTPAQVATLTAAGVVVSLGHSDAGFDTCMAYARAGASCVTHLFNAMSPLGHREPGLVGAALACPDLSAGLIADGIHVHPQAMRVALAAKTGPGRIFLVSDAMAPAGTDQQAFALNGRTVRRAQGRLTLEDGTLAGADLDLTTAIRVLTREVGLDLRQSLAAATSVPADVAGLTTGAGRLMPGTPADLIRIRRDLSGCVPLT